jgi:hypothetical protein
VNDVRAAGPERRPAMADGSWMAWTAAGIAGIWVAVTLISLLAPDMLSGSEQQHLPVAAFSAWLWGLAATVVVWGVATILGITLPEFVMGSDPTRIPIGALVAPVAAALLTVLAGIAAGVLAGAPSIGESAPGVARPAGGR